MLTIAWDVDDVLNNLMEKWLEFFCHESNCVVSYEAIIKNPPCEILNITKFEYEKSLDKFRLSNEALEMQPNSEILFWMEQYGKNFNHIALSATSANTCCNGAYWVMKNFYKYIHSYNVVPSIRSNDGVLRPFLNKGDFIQKVQGIDVLVDDNEQNIIDAQKAGCRGFLVKQPWNDGMAIRDILKELAIL